LFFAEALALIKLKTKKIIVINVVVIIIDTLTIPRSSCLLIAPVKGLIKAISKRKVSPTAIWARTLLPFLNPGVIEISIIPANTGIRAVIEGCSDVKYDQLPISINTTAFKTFIKYGFIILFFKSNNDQAGWFTFPF
jgi:hypothetical protein